MLLFLSLLFTLGHAEMLCPGGAYSDDVRNAFVVGHNSLRSQIALGNFTANTTKMPAAMNMLKMFWNCSLELTAQKWANGCPSQHSRTPGVGENITEMLKIDNTQAGTDACNAWANEFQVSGWPSLTFSIGQLLIGHATQMAWANSYSIGCGLKHCPTDGLDAVNIVCQYYIQGNVLGELTYIAGTPCGNCPTGTLCDLTTALCESSGVL